MHVPPYHKKKEWQQFLLGSLTGAIIAYILFVYIHGALYEQTVTENVQLQAMISQLERQNEALLQDKEDLEGNKTIIVQSIALEFLNTDEMHIDRLTEHKLEDMLKKELHSIIGSDVKSLAESDELLTRLIETNVFTVADTSYTFFVHKLFVAEHVKIVLRIKLAS